MVNKLLATTLMTTVLSSALVASEYTPRTEYECDAPGTDGYFLSKDAVAYADAATSCEQAGGVLADASNQNFLLLSDLVRYCVGPNQNAWVGSWDFNPTNPEERRCLAISVGHSGAGGGINPACDVDRYALCYVGGRRSHVVNHNNNSLGQPKTITVTETVTIRAGSTPAPPQQQAAYSSSMQGSTQPVTQSQQPVTQSQQSVTPSQQNTTQSQQSVTQSQQSATQSQKLQTVSSSQPTSSQKA